MMTARHLVRRLLELRRSGAAVGDLPFQIGNNLGDQAQAAVHADFGLAIQVENKMPEANGEHSAVEQSGLDHNFANLNRHVGGLAHNDGFAAYLDSLDGQSSVFGHQSLPSQSLNTVSGFWVAFKRKHAPRPSQSEASAA